MILTVPTKKQRSLHGPYNGPYTVPSRPYNGPYNSRNGPYKK